MEHKAINVVTPPGSTPVTIPLPMAGWASAASRGPAGAIGEPFGLSPLREAALEAEAHGRACEAKLLGRASPRAVLRS
jgi:hypothetical protein